MSISLVWSKSKIHEGSTEPILQSCPLQRYCRVSAKNSIPPLFHTNFEECPWTIKSNQIFIWIRQKPIHTDTHRHTQNTIYNKRRNYETVEKKTRPVNDMQYNEIIKSQVMQLMRYWRCWIFELQTLCVIVMILLQTLELTQHRRQQYSNITDWRTDRRLSIAILRFA